MIFADKYFLDFEGLESYDELIKAYINSKNGDTTDTLKAELKEVADTVDLLNSNDETEGSIANQIKKAVDGLVDGAPELLDTLKEIADWIGEDETGTAALIKRVSKNEENIEKLDVNIQNVYNAIQSIPNFKIISLFPEVQDEDTTAKDAIENVEEGKAVQLIADQVITDDIVITKSCYINANGSTFTGTVKVPADVDVVIENATFAQPVVVE